MMTTQETIAPETERDASRARLLLPAIFVLAAAGALGYGIHSGIQQRVATGKELAQVTDKKVDKETLFADPEDTLPVKES